MKECSSDHYTDIGDDNVYMGIVRINWSPYVETCITKQCKWLATDQ